MSPNVARTVAALLVPSTFRRENWEAYLFAPYSKKLSRRVYLYTPQGYDLWVHLESDPQVKTFNERPTKVPLSIGQGQAVVAAPNAISVDQMGDVMVHECGEYCETATQSKAAEKLNREFPWALWAEAQGFNYKRWTSSELRQNPILLDNYKRLLRWVCRPGWNPSPIVLDSIISALKSRRVTCWNALFRELGHFEPTSISAAIATLILDEKIHSDLHKYFLSQTTELSAFHEFD